MLSRSYVGVKGFSQPFVPARVVFAMTERRVPFVMGDCAFDGGALMSEVVCDRPGEPSVGEFVRGIGEDRSIAARQLVLALGAGFDPPQSAGKRKVDRLIKIGRAHV